jgi:hypothetical protein
MSPPMSSISMTHSMITTPITGLGRITVGS